MMDNPFMQVILTLIIFSLSLAQGWQSFRYFTPYGNQAFNTTYYNAQQFGSNRKLPRDPELEIIKPFTDRDGFFLREHIVKTEDNYLLTVHQLGRNDCSPERSVLIIHGLLAASDAWLLQGPDKDLAYILAAACYDVWLGNLRGNFYSRHNTNISPKKIKFWNFSFEEMGRLDVPAIIEKIQEMTGRRRVTLFGHSMGTVVILAMASTRPEYNQRVEGAFLMSPVALMPPADQSPFFVFRIVAKSSPFIYRTVKRMHLFEIMPRNRAFSAGLRKSCNPGRAQVGCLNAFGETFGEHRENLNLDVLGDYIVTLISGTSLKNLYHLSQLANSNGTFRMFDYGRKNPHVYGTLQPPEYPLHLATLPVFLITGQNDALLTVQVVKDLAKKLPNVVDVHVVDDPLFSHMDFVWGLNAKDVIYNRMLRQVASIGQFPL